MTKYEAEYVKQYTCIVCGKHYLITAKAKIANAINDDWTYSANWKEETWIQQAKEDCKIRIDTVTKDLNQLNEALKILETINN